MKIDNIRIDSYGTRLAILGAAIRNLFTGKGVVLHKNITVQVDNDGITMETNVWRSKVGQWQHAAVTFDFEDPPKGYLDGILISDKE
jgi:hypothetical protein